jgi:uncharacterized tellurite resistance protein B-like protein
MLIKDLYQTYEHRINLAHFSAIYNMAISDGLLNQQEENTLLRFANKLDISTEEYTDIIEKPTKYEIHPINSSEERLQYIYDLFKIIYTDHYIDAIEEKLILKYAIGLGYTHETAISIIKKSIKLFGGGLDFEAYEYLIQK